MNDSDVKGKTQAELQRMQKAKEWKTMYGSETAEFGYPVVNAKRWSVDSGLGPARLQKYGDEKRSKLNLWIT